MPEGPEVELEHVHETIHHTAEHEGGAFLKRIALTTALFAAFASVASLQAGATVNEALVLKTEATRLQAEASDQWAYYQAKGIKEGIQRIGREAWVVAGKTPPAVLDETAERYKHEQDDIKKAAEGKEHARDEKSHEADHLLERHHGFANAVALFQIAIALGAVAALTRTQLIWYGSMGAGLVAIALFGMQFAR